MKTAFRVPYCLFVALASVVFSAACSGEISHNVDDAGGKEPQYEESNFEPEQADGDLSTDNTNEESHEQDAGLLDAGAGDGESQEDGADGQNEGNDQNASDADWLVGPGREYKTPCQVSDLAQDGDVIEIDAGSYKGDVCRWRQSDITLRGVGGLAHLDADGKNYGGKGIWVIQGDRVTVEWIEFSNASVPDRNGAGIRQEGNDLTIRHCFFHDNEDGILGGGDSESVLTIEYSEFSHNGYGDGYSHNLYIGKIKRLEFRYNYSHLAKIGHNLKSRAANNIIMYNRIMDEQDGTSSYIVDLPNGGMAVIVGNLLQQGPQTDNSTMVSYGAEGLVHPVNELYMANNTLVNDRSAGTFIRVAGQTTVASLVNNLFIGPGTKVSGDAQELSSIVADGSALLDRQGFDYHLAEGSPAIDKGENPGTAQGYDLRPVLEYKHPADNEPRPINGQLDVGAYERD